MSSYQPIARTMAEVLLLRGNRPRRQSPSPLTSPSASAGGPSAAPGRADPGSRHPVRGTPSVSSARRTQCPAACDPATPTPASSRGAPPTARTGLIGTSPWYGWRPRHTAPASRAASYGLVSSARAAACPRSRGSRGRSPPTTPGGPRWQTAADRGRSPPRCSPPHGGRSRGSSATAPRPPPKGAAAPPRSATQAGDRSFQERHLLQQHPQQEAMVLRGLPKSASCNGGIFARDRCRAGSASTTGSLSSRTIARSLDLLPHQLHTLPRQVPQITHRPLRHEARLEQAALEQLGDPLAVFDVGLAAGHLLDTRGVDQQQ